jgi:hypothetical protein
MSANHEIPILTAAELKRRKEILQPMDRFVETEEGPERHPRGFLQYVIPKSRSLDAIFWVSTPLDYAIDIEEIATFETYHEWDYLFDIAPTIREVLSQIPNEYIERIIQDYECAGYETIDANTETPDRKFYVGLTTLYGKRKATRNEI